MLITAAMLRRAGACLTACEEFGRIWPTGAKVTLENVQRAVEMGLYLKWFVDRFFTGTAQQAYAHALFAARQAYDSVYFPAWNAYIKAVRESQAYVNSTIRKLSDINSTIRKLSAEYDEKAAAAMHTFNRACAAAFFELFELDETATERLHGKTETAGTAGCT